MPVTVRSGRTKLGFGVSVSADPVIAAAGDIACDPDDAAFNGGNGTATECHMRQTSDLVLGIQPTAVLALGDLQYEGGAPRKYLASYDLSWGRFKDITWPTLGNHEPGSAAGYFDYFGAAVGSPERAFYSFDLGAWHLIALNSNYENCAEVSGVDCALAAVQQSWLRDDLARHRNRCTLAYFHFPRFSSGPHGSHASVAPLWDALYTAGADVVVNGHDHNYERFAPQTPTGVADPNGLREFVVGTGGRSLRRLRKPEPNSEASSDSAFGVLKLVLGPSAYEWEFVSEPGQPFRDRGAGVCH